MKQFSLSHWKIVITGIVAFLLSIVWYSPIAFGTIWKRYRSAPNPDIPQWTMVLAPLRELLTAYIVAYLLLKTGSTKWQSALKLVVLLWAAFHAVGMVGAVLWDNMHWQLGAIHAGDWLMKLVFIGGVLTLWRNKRDTSTPETMQ